jgi:hypothetical protein
MVVATAYFLHLGDMEIMEIRVLERETWIVWFLSRG